MHVRTLDLAANNILQFEISKMVVAAIWNIEKPQYLPYVRTSFEKIWHGDVPRSSRPRQHMNFYAFYRATPC